MDPMGKETFFLFQASVSQFSGKSMREMYVVCDMCLLLAYDRNYVKFNMLLFLCKVGVFACDL